MRKGQAKSSEVTKTEASPCQPGILSPTPNPWAEQRKQIKKRAKKVSAIEQHYHELLSAAWSPLRVNALSCPHPTHSPDCVDQSFTTLPSFNCQ